MSVVRQIKAELMAVDANLDGKIDASELKELLRKHHGAFTDKEIVEIGDLYYAGKAGGSVSFDRFIEAVDRAADNTPKIDRINEDKYAHFKNSDRHPLGDRKSTRLNSSHPSISRMPSSA